VTGDDQQADVPDRRGLIDLIIVEVHLDVTLAAQRWRANSRVFEWMTSQLLVQFM